MPAMPRKKQAEKVLEKIIGLPDNKTGKVKPLQPRRIDQGINTVIDSMFNHPI